MKAKKAIKRLDNVEALLSDVIDQFAGANGVRDLLDSARETVFRARTKVNEQENPKSGKNGATAKKKSNRAATKKGEAASKTA